MNKLFDYIFYRVYKQYEKWHEDYPYPFAEGVIVVIQGFIILSVLTILSSLNILPRNIESHKIYALSSFVVLYLINHRRYKKKFTEIISAYDKIDEPSRKRNGFFIVVLIITVVLFPIVIGVLRNNFGYNI
jgi:amino acid permease